MKPDKLNKQDRPDKRDRTNKPNKPEKPDGSGPDPCWVERRSFWLKGIAASKLKMPVQLSSEKGRGKSRATRGPG